VKVWEVMEQQKKVEEIYWELPYQCKKCGCRFETQSKMQKHTKIHKLLIRLDVILYKGRIIRYPYNIKTGICANCGTQCQTQLHHIAYHDEDPLRDTLELCPTCHSKWHAENTEGWGTTDSKLW